MKARRRPRLEADETLHPVVPPRSAATIEQRLREQEVRLGIREPDEKRKRSPHVSIMSEDVMTDEQMARWLERAERDKHLRFQGHEDVCILLRTRSLFLEPPPPPEPNVPAAEGTQ